MHLCSCTYTVSSDPYFGSAGAVHLQVIHAAISILMMFQSLHILSVHPDTYSESKTWSIIL